MKAAVPFENGRIFQHFGKTSAFLVAEIEDQEVKSEQLRSTNGSGHGALSALLSEWGVDTVICGGIGQGAVNALSEKRDPRRPRRRYGRAHGPCGFCQRGAKG